ncbi:MAG: replication factor C small subunit [Candidatus Diapherotrites archaeon CG11_big_fil_rev_8_21_14_0_20_37_9]|nr:MAG: replication factor C small subunit [Candidatus Diapherotrites archaeon CG11_big_fil_rev_8_21_14_0_20_37_9]
MATTAELPWVEKYRPHKLRDVIGQKDITSRLENYVKNNTMPNLMFSGQAGIGKTSASVALAKEFFGTSFNQNFLELNASDERGIDVVRETIKNFARTLAFDSGFKIIFLDESDALTMDAQQALRRTMEKYARTCRFILSCNFSSKIIEPIQSRCVVFRFKPLSAKDIEDNIKKIAKEENIEIDQKALEAIVYVSEGDMRKAVNVLQASASVGQKLDEKTIHEVSARARPDEVKEMIKTAMKGNFLEARKMLDTLMYEYGMSGEDVILQMHRELINMPEEEISGKIKIELVDTIGEYNFRMVEGANERVQLEALLAQFTKFSK